MSNPIRLLFLTNSEVSRPLADWLSARSEVGEIGIFSDKLTVETLRVSKPDLVVSYGYRHIIRQVVLDELPGRFINLHISMLPFNRGADPTAWSFLENTPKGVSIHLIDSGVDTGDILFQREVAIDETVETLASAYARLQSEIQSLFKENWPVIGAGDAIAKKQVGEGTAHKAAEFAAIKTELLGDEGWDVEVSTFKRRFERLAFRRRTFATRF